jgi:hypothetical protein
MERDPRAQHTSAVSSGLDLIVNLHPCLPDTASLPLRAIQIAYVLGTEDFFHRKRARKATMDKAARMQRFAAFITQKAAASLVTP